MDGHKQFGDLFIAHGDSAATTITTHLTYYPVAGTYTLGGAFNFVHDTNGQLKYNGTLPRVFHIIALFSVSVDTSDDYHFRLGLNGTAIENSEQQRNVGAAGLNTLGIGGCQLIVTLNPGDYISMFVTSDTQDGPELTLEHIHIIAKEA